MFSLVLSLNLEVPARRMFVVLGNVFPVIGAVWCVPFVGFSVSVFGFILRVGFGELLTQILTSRETLHPCSR